MTETTRLQVVRQGSPERLDVLLAELEKDLWDLRLLNMREVAKVLGISESGARRRVAEGYIPAQLEGGRLKVQASRLRAYIESLPDGGGSH